jgi:hypothetical protein
MRASEVQRLIVERRTRALDAGSWAAVSVWLKQQHGAHFTPEQCEALYIAAQKKACRSQSG